MSGKPIQVRSASAENPRKIYKRDAEKHNCELYTRQRPSALHQCLHNYLLWKPKSSDCRHKDQIGKAGPETGLASEQGTAPHKMKATLHYYLQPFVQTLALDFSPGQQLQSQSHFSKWQYNPPSFSSQTPGNHSSLINRLSPIVLPQEYLSHLSAALHQHPDPSHHHHSPGQLVSLLLPLLPTIHSPLKKLPTIG